MASYPSSAKSFSTKVDGVDLVQAAHINDIQAEVKAVEDQLIASKLSTLTSAPAASQVLTTNGSGAPTWEAAANFATASHNHSGVYPGIDGWIPVSATWTYASATTITVPSGAAAIYSVGQGFRLTANGVVKQGYIAGVADTLLTTVGDELTNHTFSAISYTNTPSTAIGFPVWFNWAPTLTGWTEALPAGGVYRYCNIGKLVILRIGMSGGTSNDTVASMTLPFSNYAAQVNGTNGYVINGGAVLTGASRWNIPGGGTSVNFYTDMASGAWTATGAKRIYATVIYESA